MFEYAVRALERRPLTEGELKLRLTRRAAERGDVEVVLQRLRRADYLNDERTAASYARYRREVELYGSRRVLHDLLRRQIPSALAERTVDAEFDGVDETELIRAHLRRRYGRRAEERVADPGEAARLHRALLRAGFHSDKIGEVLRRIAAAPEWFDGLGD